MAIEKFRFVGNVFVLFPLLHSNVVVVVIIGQVFINDSVHT